MAATSDALRLFNCQPNGSAPDWSAFVALRLGGCIDHEGETEGCVSAASAEFFTVYGIDSEGLAEAITDTDLDDSVSDARALLHEMGGLSGLPVHLCPFLELA